MAINEAGERDDAKTGIARRRLSLAAVFSVRLLGLFMIYPVFAAYARGLDGATPYLIGEALGIYGLTKGCCRFPSACYRTGSDAKS